MTIPPVVTRLLERRRARLRPLLLGELLIVAVLVRIYDNVRSLADVRSGDALSNALDVLRVERVLHLDVELSANHWLSRHAVAEIVAGCWYQAAHLSVTLSLLAWCWWKRPIIYRAARNALVVINLVALAVFFWLPVMPPRLLPGGGFVDSVADAGLGTAPVGPVQAAAYAAMPSLHLAWATWVALVGVTLSRPLWVRLVSALYPLLTTAVVVLTGNHYVLDVFAGVAVALACALLTGLVTGRTGLLAAMGQITRRRSRIPSTQALGTSVPQTVIRR